MVFLEHGLILFLPPPPPPPPLKIDVSIVDAMAVVHNTKSSDVKTFGDLFHAFANKIGDLSGGGGGVIVQGTTS